MTQWMIDEVVDSFVTAAQHADQAAGQSGARRGYVFSGFLSPATGPRTDTGPFEGGSGFSARGWRPSGGVGPDYPLSVRLSADAAEPGLPARTSPVAPPWRTRMSTSSTCPWAPLRPGPADGRRHEPPGYQLKSAGTAQGISPPQDVTGRFRAIEQVERVLAAGGLTWSALITRRSPIPTWSQDR
jgi:2,4-dienoyl-CoA reductase-like NADH-dependent reductase (Old Yellow Enzyme family)